MPFLCAAAKMKEIFCNRETPTWSWKRCEFAKNGEESASKFNHLHDLSICFDSLQMLRHLFLLTYSSVDFPK